MISSFRSGSPSINLRKPLLRLGRRLHEQQTVFRFKQKTAKRKSFLIYDFVYIDFELPCHESLGDESFRHYPLQSLAVVNIAAGIGFHI